MLVRQLAMGPAYGVIGRLEAVPDHMGKMKQDLVVELAPDQLVQPAARAVASSDAELVRGGCQLAYRHRAKAQMGAEVARPLDRWVVTRLPVLIDALEKIGKQAACTGTAGGDAQLGEVAGFKTQIG